MSDESAPKRRFVSCPKCRQLLQEPPGCDLYKCGECGTTLQAKKQKDRYLNTESSTQETGAASSSSEEFSLDGASEFREPSYIGGWRGLVRIELVDNKICELPQSPEFPKLKVLLLQGNVDLMDIPESFFNHMPLLQHLDLSNTSIRDLPLSISKLTELITFYIRSCDLFLELPPQIGQLKKLVELDLDDTLITHLPIEVRELINLQRLILCFDGGYHSSSTIIPPGVISNLTLLKYLSINVDPEDDRWNVNNVANILVEISGLMRLETTCIHVPEAKLLELIPARESLNFKLVVGHYKRRFISRVTPELEQKFKCYDHYIKFVNGVDIPNGVNMNLERFKALYLDRHMTIKSLADFELMSLHSLEECILAECNDMETIVDGRASYSHHRPALPRLESLAVFYMKNLRSICERPLQMNTTSFFLCSLKSMSLHTCPMLTAIFSISFIENLSLLEELIVEDCPKVTTLVSHDSSKHGKNIFLPKLRKIWLLYLPELINIFNGLLHVGQSLQEMGFYYCPKLQSLSKTELSSQDLRVIKGESRWWQTLKWNEAEWGDAGQPNFLKLIFSPINAEADVMAQLAAHHDVDGDQLRREREIFDFCFLDYPPSKSILSDRETPTFEFEEPTNECSNSMASQTKHSNIQAKTMEEVLNSAKHACELAQYLGAKLADMANQPSMLLMSIDDVVKAFGVAKERLLLMSQQDLTITPSFASMLPHDQTHISATSGSSMHEQFMLKNESMASGGGGDIQELRYRGTPKIGEIGVTDLEGLDGSQVTEEMQSRKRSRKNDLKKRIILVPAPQVGNTEMRPDDGFTWRKYGQKEVLGTKYPRGYFRCTYRYSRGCLAVKQVQRRDDNPNIFEVTYRGEHTCQMSSTAPSSFPLAQLLDMSKDNMTQTQSPNTISPQLPPSSTSDSA